MRHLQRGCAQSTLFLRLVFLLILFTTASAQELPKEAGHPSHLRPDDDSVLITVTVMDKKGNYIGGLDRSAFTLYDNKERQDISYFSAADEPMSVGVIFDLSGSMIDRGRQEIMAAENAFMRFTRVSSSENEYFLIGFASQVRLLTDWTRSGKALEDGIRSWDINTKKVATTALYDACYLGLEKMRGRANRKRVLLLISDGQDNNSRYTFKEVRERFRESGVILYAVGISNRVFGDPTSFLDVEGQAVMSEFTSISGGVTVFPDNKKKIEAVFDQIAVELRHQYLVGFKPRREKADGKWHQLKIKVTTPPGAPPNMSSLIVRSREGYYAPRP